MALDLKNDVYQPIYVNLPAEAWTKVQYEYSDGDEG